MVELITVLLMQVAGGSAVSDWKKVGNGKHLYIRVDRGSIHGPYASGFIDIGTNLGEMQLLLYRGFHPVHLSSFFISS